MLDIRMKEACRICARELCGNQRRWIFHPASKLNLQVLLSHALGRELIRDGRGEFACSKCAFILERMYRFDTVIARVEALSIERLQRLLQEKHRLRGLIGGLYRKTNREDGGGCAGAVTGPGDTGGGGGRVQGEGMVDMSGLTHAKYCALLQEDLVYSLYESWAEEGLEFGGHNHHHHGHRQQCAGPAPEVTAVGSQRCGTVTRSPRKCRGCTAWRVADSDYEAVCKVPRKLARSISCDPSTRYSVSVIGGGRASGGGRGGEKDPDGTPSSLTLIPGSNPTPRASDSDPTLVGRASSSPSIDSLDITGESTQLSAIQDGPEGLEYPQDPLDDRFSDSLSEEHHLVTPLRSASRLSLALCLVQNCVYRPVQSPKGSRLPVLNRQGPSSRGSRLSFHEPALGLLYGGLNGEGEIHVHVPDLEAPLIRLDGGIDGGLDLAEIEELWEDLYHECPPPRPHQTLIEEQQSQLNQYECAAGQCVSELQKAQQQVQSLQAKSQESEANNAKLQEKLIEMECELRSIRQGAQSQERTIQCLTDSVSTKDNEAVELYQLIEGQNATLCKLREMAHRNQITHTEDPEGGSEGASLAQFQGELVGLQSSLFTLGLELEASQRAQKQSQRQAEDLSRAKDRLHSDLKEALQHREVTDKHNQDLRSALAQSGFELRTKKAQLEESKVERRTEVQERDKNITQLKHSLQDKERQLQEYSELLESADSSKPRDALLDKLRERIRDRDRALERSIDEKFSGLEEREEQVRKLQLALREKERDLERLRCILSNNEETITSLDGLVRGKELDVEQTAEALRNLQWLQQQSEEREKCTLRERDTLISQLQTALQTRSQETQDLTAALLAKVQAGPSGVVEELKARLALKEKLFQELLSDRSRQSHEHQAQVQDLLSTISTKDQYIQDCSDRLSQVIGERTGQLQELRRQLSSQEREMGELRKERMGEAERLQNLLKEKEAFIQSLMQSQEESMELSTPEGAEEVQAIREELQLVRKKEKEAQLEISALRSALAQAQEQAQKQGDRFKILAPGVIARDPSNTDHQSVLEQLASEYHRLNDALRAEKRLYQSLSHIQARGNSTSEKTRALHTELDSIQALRGQLEEVLARTRKTALALERTAKRQSDFGELSTEEEEEGDDEQGSTDEFSDSIEDDEDKLTAKSLASTKNSGMACGQGVLSGGPVSGALSQGAMGQVKQLAEQKRAIEEELEEMRTQLETTGYSSLAQMRSTLLRLQQENEALKENQEEVEGLGELEDPTDTCQGWEQKEEEEMEEGLPAVGPTQSKRGPPSVRMREGRGKRRCTRPHSLDLGTLLSHRQPDHTEKEAGSDDVTHDVGGFWQHVETGLREHVVRLRSDLALSRQESRELQERLMVSEATVHAQAEQLKDYRELLTETSVEQDSKQVQVDLQDLGYETCGRSENEAEREDASSPEFDDLEMCTSLSHQQDYERAGVWFHGDGGVGGAYDEGEESVTGSLQQLVQDLRSKLARCHKVIRGLQLRVRSLSTTSDYASSLERPQRKVNWAFEASPAPSGVEEDEGWMSDSLGPRMEPKPSRELQELMSRVASLEAQLKSSRLEGKGRAVEEGKCATWPGKYNTLIQAQARELSHLRQKMREGRGVCHILTQHLGDTTKAFEELLRANDIDYYMGQSFREQLAQSTALAQRVGTKISGRDRAELHDDKMGHELLALRLSKELQQKDKIIESLHTKLQQRSDTPCSSHAHSETTDQSDRTSFVSDECRTNEDLELCSDVDEASEYAQGEQEQGARHGPGNTGVDLIEEHLREVRCLRQRLEETIRTNEKLRQQLEERLATTGRDGGANTNIYIQGVDSVSQLSNEIRVLKEENLALQAHLQASSDTCEEAEQLREVVVTGHARLKQAELEAEQWKEELRRLQTHSQEQGQQIHTLRQERQNSHDKNNRLQQQLCESRELLHSLQSELQVYHRVCVNAKGNPGYLCEGQYGGVPALPVELGELLGEVRSLRAQLQSSVQENSVLKQLELHKHLEQKLGGGVHGGVGVIGGMEPPRTPSLSALTASPQRDSLYRRQLLHDPAPSPPVRDIGLFNCGSPYHVLYTDLEETPLTANDLDPHSELEGDAPDGSFSNRNGRHAIGHVDDYSALQQQVLEGRSLVQRMETALQACLSQSMLEGSHDQVLLDYGRVRSLLSNTKTLRQILEEVVSLMKMFWRAALPSTDRYTHNLKKEQCMQEEILSLRGRISEQGEVLQGTIQRLRSTSRTKEGMEHFIVKQLSRTRDVLKKARTNLELKTEVTPMNGLLIGVS